MNPISHLSAVAAAIFLLLGAYTLYLKPRSRLNQIFALLCLSFTAWNVCFIFLITAADKPTAWFWYRLSAVGWCVGPALLFHFFLLLTSRRMIDRHPWLIAMVYGTAAIFFVRLAFGTVYATDFVRTPYGWDEVVGRIDGWSAAYLLFYLSSAVAGLWLVYRWGARSALAREKKQARIILFSAAPTLLLVSLSNVVLRLLGIHAMPGLAPILLPIWGAGIMVAVVQYDLMVLDPQAAAHRILETMVDSLLLLDPEKTILTGNRAAAKLFGIEETRLVGMRLTELIPGVEIFEGMELDRRLASGALRNA
jgi:PAS domain-containing protein